RAGIGSLEGSAGGGEVGGKGLPRNVGRPLRIHCDTLALVIAVAAQVGGVDQPAAGGIQLGYKSITGPSLNSLDGTYGREVGGAGQPRDVGRAVGINRNASACVAAAAAQVGGVDQPAAG